MKMDKELEKRLNSLTFYTFASVDENAAEAAIEQIKKTVTDFSINPKVIPLFVEFYLEAQRYFFEKRKTINEDDQQVFGSDWPD
jgi:predicted TIM-barrel fold metal-dependent hydrolase